MNFSDFLRNNLVILDGGLGTLLQAKGLKPGEFPELWNITNPQIVTSIHKDYFDAGSNVVCTNTFGANSLKFSDEELEKIIKSAIDNANKAKNTSSSNKDKFIALDIGPTGRLLKPFGDLDFEEAVNIFAKTIKIGAEYGVDLIIIETMNDSYETKAALLAAKENCNLPVIVSNAYGSDGKLMTGASPALMVAMLEGMGADAIGANCSLGPKQLKTVAEELLENASVPVVIKPNAGLPKSINNKTVYDISAEEFAKEMLEIADMGARVLGGCCGTTPEFISNLAKKTKNSVLSEITKKDRTVVTSYTKTVDFNNIPVLIGERINPTGKKRFKKALIENDIDYILSEGVAQQEKGVHILDVNVGLPEINETDLLKSAVTELQAVSDLPLQIDTSSIPAMETALRYYNGKPMINSVNGKEENMAQIFPLVKKYGGVVVALTLDENGIPDSAEQRVKIAEKIINTAKKYGIDKKDIVFDTLAMTISAEKTSALTTISALAKIKNELGCHTSLGISNVSFGLPQRDAINGTFFALALQSGLSAAIINPYSADIMKTYYSFKALSALDDNCKDYIENADSFITAVQNQQTAVANQPREFSSELQKAIIKGFKEKSAELTKELLKTSNPLDIVNGDIISALDVVGIGFENKTVYLPQLLMSAEAAKCAFEEIKSFMADGKTKPSDDYFVIATVKGDIHDIGKNIVKLLLQNYGFNVVDLGKDVPPEIIVRKVAELKAPLCGLSALMTTTVPAMEKTLELLKKETPWCKTVVGGAVLTEEYAEKIGADKYAKDAMETVRYAKEIIKNNK
ncbi:MAG: homocysteine S-methyltransferase family protein [Clostridia bacterium]|nr:homocysteine S-methyltransferase family protein [Clostridia bacterium]